MSLRSRQCVTPRTAVWVAAGLLGTFTLWLNFPVLDHDWVYFDDDINIVLNPHLTGGSLETVKWACSDWQYARRFMPLGWLMFDLLFGVAGLNPAAFHAASWVLAAVNSGLLFALIYRWLIGIAPRASKPAVSFLVAGAIGLAVSHPLRAESVGWASGLLYLGAETLALIACLLAVLREPSWVRSAASCIFFCASLLTYPIYLALPLLAAAMNMIANAASKRPLAIRGVVKRYAGWCVASIALGAFNFYAAATSVVFPKPPSLEAYPLAARLIDVGHAFVYYLSRLVWPGLTSPYYGLGGPPLPAIAMVAAISAALLGLLIHRNTRTWTATSLAAFAIALLAFVVSAGHGRSFSDRYAIVLLACAAASVSYACVVLAGPRARQVAFAVTLLAIAGHVLPYREALSIWRNTDVLQARMDTMMMEQPNVRLAITRPAIIDFLRGHYQRSADRLAHGMEKYNGSREILEATEFIAEVRQRCVRSLSPFAVMHMDLAREHVSRRHEYAASVHRAFAARLPVPDEQQERSDGAETESGGRSPARSGDTLVQSGATLFPSR